MNSSEASQEDTNVIDIIVSGMTCGACSMAVTSALNNVEGVISADVSLVTERAVVYFNGLNPVDLTNAIEDAGFDAQIVSSRVCTTAIDKVLHGYKLDIQVDGMTCGSCSSAVRKAVEKLKGVTSAEVSLTTDTVYISYEITDTQYMGKIEQDSVKAIEDAGFDATVLRNVKLEDRDSINGTNINATTDNNRNFISNLDLKVFGLYDGNRETLVSAIEDLHGVFSAILSSDLLSIQYDNNTIGVRAVIKKIESLGLSALVAASADNAQQLTALNRVKELQLYYYNTIKAFCLGMPVILILKFSRWMPYFLTVKIGRGLWMDDLIGVNLILFLLTGPASQFYRKTAKALRAGAPTMDVLITTSVTCAYLYSVLALTISITTDMETHQTYLWDACAMIIMFVLLGKYLENLARGQTSKALSDLISLVPEKSLVIANDTDENGELMATDMLQVNDIVILRPGERVSADGIVIDGESFVSEAIITGEAEPVRKVAGELIVGGTINGLGTLRFKVTQCGPDTKLSQIVSFIKDAQASRAPIQRYADIVASKFVPVVLSLAFITFIFWFSVGLVFGKERLPHPFHTQSLFLTCLRLGIAVVVVACPCALGLATPTAVMVGTGVGAKFGILVKGGSTFERGSQASAVLFDKTGTLTTGNMSVITTTVDFPHWVKVRAVEALSEHPVGKALSCYIHPKERLHHFATDTTTESSTIPNGKSDMSQITLIAENVIVHPGEGIEGQVDGSSVFIGRKNDFIDGSIHVFIDNEDVGTVTLKDSLRSDAFTVVERLRAQGMLVGVVSGDSTHAVNSIAKELGIPEQYTWSKMKPEDKVKVIQSFRDEGREVVFVGDGINDSPALVAASVGISLEGATHVAVESSDIVITQHSPIGAVPAALDLCCSTMTRIKRNLFMSVIYNAIMIPFAMGLLLHFRLMLSPMMASAAMALSSVSVVVSSLLLKLWKPEPLDNDLYSAGTPTNLWEKLILKFKLLRSRQSAEYFPV